MFPTLFAFRCLQETWWRSTELGMALGAVEMGRGCEQWCSPELVLPLLWHWSRSPLSWLNMRISLLCSAPWPDLGALFHVSSGVNLTFVCVKTGLFRNLMNLMKLIIHLLNGELLAYSNLRLLESPRHSHTAPLCCLLCAVCVKSARKSVWRWFDWEEVGGYLHFAVSLKTL